MTALQAREAAQSAQIGLLSLYKCLQLVENAAFLGHTQLALPCHPSAVARRYLQDMGYGYSEAQRILIW